MLELCSIASGSKGNAYVVGIDGSYLLVDCGISARRLTRSLARVGFPLDSIEAILITHEHRDHVAGLDRFRKECPVPVYATEGTWEAIPRHGPGPFHPVEAERPFAVGPFRVHPIPVSHDATEPVAYRVETERGAVAVVTDLGRTDEGIRCSISGLRALVLESNHDEEMLRSGSYPWYLKERILSDYGHLSNRASQAALVASAHDGLEVVLLAHLSEENNRPDLALDGAVRALRGNRWEGVKTTAASQEETGEVFTFP
jgi:phosphoribosyl 1,2-cyclic phosphodiesterase